MKIGVSKAIQNDSEERKWDRHLHARRNEIDTIKIMSKLFVGILLASVLIGMLAVVPENARAETWSIETVDSDEEVGQYTPIALDSDNNSHISYYDFSTHDFKYAKLMPDAPTPPRNLEATAGDGYVYR